MEKTCKICNSVKPITDFYKKPSGKFGVDAKCKLCAINKSKKYRDENLEKVKAYQAEYKRANKDAGDEYAANYREANRSKHADYMKRYFQANKARLYTYYKERKKNDPLFRLSCSIRSLISTSFANKFTKKAKRTTEILGCSFEQFKEHIEKQFTAEMSWQNYGTYWEFDHIKPVALAVTAEDLYALNHFTNFQPLYWEDNIRKGSSYGL